MIDHNMMNHRQIDHRQMKLGRRAIQRDPRTLALCSYLAPSLPAPPASQDWSHGVSNWAMMLNDQLGCCTIAGIGHAIQVWTANNGAIQTVSDSVIERYYEQWDGYKPGDASTDNGGIELEVLKAWRKQGFAGNRLLAFADASVSNLTELRQAIHLFGGVYIGVDLPLSAQNQDVWDVAAQGGNSAEKGSWGGHCVFVTGYDQKGFTCITWGQLKTMTTAFWQMYVDEAHALLDESWFSAQRAPSGFNRTQLMADLKQIR